MSHISLGARAPVTTMVIVVALVWALCWVGTARCSDLDSDVVETKTGGKLGDDDVIDTFDSPAAAPLTAPAPAPAPKSKGGLIPLLNGDFELTNGTSTGMKFADNTSADIVNWVVNGAGVYVYSGVTYGGAPETPHSQYSIMLNNPGYASNGTQGSLSTTLAHVPSTGKTYTVQYDIARAPDGPSNLWPAVKVMAMQGPIVHDWVVHMTAYNASDSIGHSTWTRQSFAYKGTGAVTVIKFESLSEKYGPMIDNVECLTGLHTLSHAGAPLREASRMCQRLPLATAVALAFLRIF